MLREKKARGGAHNLNTEKIVKITQILCGKVSGKGGNEGMNKGKIVISQENVINT